MICDDCFQEIRHVHGRNWTLRVDGSLDSLECDKAGDGRHTPARCLDDHTGIACRGPVELRYSPFGQRSWPRCAAHEDAQWERYDDSIARYSYSDCVPDWFDPDYAGERWEDD
jgi:hypothetical protein